MTHTPSDQYTIVEVDTKDVIRRIHVLLCGHLVAYEKKCHAGLKRRHCPECHRQKMRRMQKDKDAL